MIDTVFDKKSLSESIKILFYLAAITIPGFMFLYATQRSKLLEYDGLLVITLAVVITGCFYFAAITSWILSEVFIRVIDKKSVEGQESLLTLAIKQMGMHSIMLFIYMLPFVLNNHQISSRTLFIIVINLSFVQGFIYRLPEHNFTKRHYYLFGILFQSVVLIIYFLLYKIFSM